MASEKLRMLRRYLFVILKFGFTQLLQKCQASIHFLTYQPVPPSHLKNIVILGGSYSGIQLAKRLMQTLSPGYKVILVEKNSHFQHLFNFPRYSVVEGREERAFIPYSGLAKFGPEGIFELVRDTGVAIEEGSLKLAGDDVPFEFLAIATGTKQNPPAKLGKDEMGEACGELRGMQGRIKTAERIAIVGGGAVGVQLAGDIKTIYPQKEVVLIHSRKELLTSFGGGRLHDHVSKFLKTLGISIILSERPDLSSITTTSTSLQKLTLSNGQVEEFNLIIPTTGQTPNSAILSHFSPTSISPTTSHILVTPTLQILSPSHPNIFALGDVAETGGPKMARAGMAQAEIVRENICEMIRGGKAESVYRPIALEGSLKLSLGVNDHVMYVREKDGEDFLIPGKSGNIDLDVKRVWKHVGATYP